MTVAANTQPVLLCFDGSDDAAHAIAGAGRLLGPRPAVVITVLEPIRLWSPADPATLLEAPVGKLLSKSMKLEEIAGEVAEEEVSRGVALARDAGFAAEGRIAHGKPWRAICDAGDEIDAAAIVLGARGLSRVQSALLGSVSSSVSAHAGRPTLIVHPSRPARGSDHDSAWSPAPVSR
jgi:nucleotide-binding universal stress UspA family protein